MRPLVQAVALAPSPESVCRSLGPMDGLVLLRSRFFESPRARYSLLAANPFLRFRSAGARCEVISRGEVRVQFGNPWHLLDSLMARYELLDEPDLPFPTGGCFGVWGYDLKGFVEPKLRRRAINDLELPDCQVGFYDSLVVFDHHLDKTWIVATGLAADGSRSDARAARQAGFWHDCLQRAQAASDPAPLPAPAPDITSTLTRDQFIALVRRAQAYIRSGDIYQVNLSQRFTAPVGSGWELYRQLSALSPAPFSAYLDLGDWQLASSSPELFLRLSGSLVETRPIKGTRPRSADSTRDAQLTYELQTSPKELAELVMITDLLRNDLGRFCEYGTVQVPELVRLERYSQVQHLMSTVTGSLRAGVTHFQALMSAFPGGSITGAPKFRAMEIIDELEPVARGPYTGALGYLGFNRESQLSIIIRTAVCKDGLAHYHAGAGIVADSNPEAEYDETLDKANAFLVGVPRSGAACPAPRAIAPIQP